MLSYVRSHFPAIGLILGGCTGFGRLLELARGRLTIVTIERDNLSPPDRIRRIAIQRLESYRSAGITHWKSASEDWSEMPAKKDPVKALAVIEQEVSQCQRCDQLAATRNNTVFGDGNPRARLCFLGEAPGRDEDKQGVPFVGRAGQLLNDIIKACTLERAEVYILNVIKCRPPENRNPSSDEAENCRGFLQGQLEVIQPEFICCLGTVAAQNLLESKETIGQLRGRFHEYQGIKVLATYHPAYLLRNPSAKRQVWNDMKILMQEMGIPVPG